MKAPPVPGWKATTSKQPVFIPNAAGDGVAETIMTEVPAWQDPKTGTIYLDGEAHEILDTVKARHLGILLPDQLRDMRKAIGLTQKKMAELLQLGEKTWTRWETGAERPSRSMNVLLCALHEGKIDVGYLRSKQHLPLQDEFGRWEAPEKQMSTYKDSNPNSGAADACNASIA
jgi:DNA-binding transcriptional regulator YiaG